MKFVRKLPFGVDEEANVLIPMADGVHLAARIWRPHTDRPVPAVVEYIPYRKRFGTAQRDEVMHPYMAGHGFASIRVDLRGSGESDGVLEDEYLQQELDDGCEVLAWLGRQPWCNGRIGMIGISWGGFNGLQIAAMQPPELKAVVAVCASDDRYADDVHHMGGCLLGDNISWASVMFAYNTLPPDPELVGDQWREMWFERLNGSGLWLEKWLRHQRRDEFWRHASVREDYGAIQCPVYAVSGWADGYTNVVFRLMANLDVPRKGLIGPWSHKYPHQGVPGPAIGFLQEVRRWWDHWLGQQDTGITEEPMLKVWMQDSVPPVTHYQQRPGRWVAEPSWPSTQIRDRSYALCRTGLEEECARPEGQEYIATIRSPLTVGLFAGKWCSYAAGPDLAHDQREEDGGALVFESAPLDQQLEIMGESRLELEFSSDRPVAMVAVRLSDVAADDKATRVTYGLLNLTHYQGSEHPQPLEPGRKYRAAVTLNGIAHSFPAGHRLRLSLSTSYWPLAWPPPEPVCLSVHTHGCRLVLPERPPRDSDRHLIAFDPPEGTRPGKMTRIEPPHRNWLVHRDLAADRSTLEVINDDGVYRLEDIDLQVSKRTVETYSTTADDFTSPRAEVVSERALKRGDWAIRSVTRTVVTSTPGHFLVHANMDIYQNFAHGERRVLSKNWDETIPRDLL